MSTPPFQRTVCGCATCVSCCKRHPGPLAPGDFERIAEFLGERPEEAVFHFGAAPGAILMRRGRVLNVPTITPRMDRTGRCTFLGENDRCRIHPVSPMGCAYFDPHMGGQEADRRSLWMYERIAARAAYQELRSRLAPVWSYFRWWRERRAMFVRLVEENNS